MEKHFLLIMMLVYLLGEFHLSNTSVKIDISKSTLKNVTTTTSPTTMTSPNNVTPFTTILPITTTPSTSINGTTISTPTTSTSITTTTPKTLNNETDSKMNKTNTMNKNDNSPSSKGFNKRAHTPPDYYCRCDLITNMCDTNCCCDIDCTDDQHNAFDCTEDHLTIFDYDWQSGLQSCKIKWSLFCVVRQTEDTSPIEFFDTNLNIKSHYYQRNKWPEPFTGGINGDGNSHPNDFDRKIYKFGDNLQFYNEINEQIEILEIPSSFTKSVTMLNDCNQIKLPIKFLNDKESICRRTKDQQFQFVQQFQSQLLNTKIFASRQLNTAMMTEYCGGGGGSENSAAGETNCIPIQIFDCITSEQQYPPSSSTLCHAFNNNTNDIDTNKYEIDENHQNQEIHIEIIHNFTTIHNCSVYFYYQTDENASVVRFMKIKFLQINQTDHAHWVSGNIGYKTGLPVIISKLLSINVTTSNNPAATTSTTTVQVLEYFHENQTEHNFFKIPIIRKNQCHLNNVTYQTINFGHNFFLKCNIQYVRPPLIESPTAPVQPTSPTSSKFTDINRQSNFTEICLNFQEQIFYYLLNSIQQMDNETQNFENLDLSILVSEYGNPINKTNHWIKIELTENVDISDDTKLIVGRYNKDENDLEFSCENMILNVNYEFQFGNLRVGSIKHQQLIRRVRIKMGKRLTLKFRFDEDMIVPIFVDVMFLDLTATSNGSNIQWLSKQSYLMTIAMGVILLLTILF